MARGGITKVLVKKARDALIAKGGRPTIDAIRIELGNTGSKTTISRYLKELDETEGTRLDDEDLLSENLKEIIARLAHTLHSEAVEIVEVAESHHKHELIKAESKLSALQNTLDETQDTYSHEQTKLTEEQQSHNATQEELIELKAQLREKTKAIQGFEQRIEDKDRQLLSLEEKHQHARQSLEHYRQSVKDQRDQDLRLHEQQVQQLQAEAQQQSQRLIVRQNELTQSTKDNARLSAELTASQRELRDTTRELKSLHSIVDELNKKHGKWEVVLAQSQADYEVLQSINKNVIEQRDASLTVLSDRETTIVQLQSRIEIQNALYNDLKENFVNQPEADVPNGTS